MTPISPTGMLIQKIQRQEKTVVMKPPSGGPITGPISAGMVSQASAEMSSALGTERKMTRRPTGTIMAPPMPWMMRNKMKSGSDWAKPQAAEPSVNTIMAARNTVRAPKRSATQPLSGMKTASDKRYEVSASLSASGSSWRSAAMAGRDVAITVESIVSMKSATATMRVTK